MREDNSEKPSWHALHKLIHEDWSTDETLTTDAEGTLSFTGFKGSYRLETAKGQESFTLERDTEASVRLAK